MYNTTGIGDSYRPQEAIDDILRLLTYGSLSEQNALPAAPIASTQTVHNTITNACLKPETRDFYSLLLLILHITIQAKKSKSDYEAGPPSPPEDRQTPQRARPSLQEVLPEGTARQPRGISAGIKPGCEVIQALPVRCTFDDLTRSVPDALTDRGRSWAFVTELFNRGCARLYVDGMPDIKWKRVDFLLPNVGDIRRHEYARHAVGAKVTAAVTQAEISYCDFPPPPPAKASYTTSQLEEMFEMAGESSHISHYRIGDPLFLENVPFPALACGQELDNVGPRRIAGFHTTTHFWADGSSHIFTPMHLEPLHASSIKLVLAGLQAVLAVPPWARELLERRIATYVGEKPTCSMSVSHHSLVVRPSLLRQWGIPFNIEYAVAGQGLVVVGGSYHQTITVEGSPCSSAAVNFKFANEADTPSRYQHCSRTECGNDALQEEDLLVGWSGRPGGQDAEPAEDGALANSPYASQCLDGGGKRRQRSAVDPATPSPPTKKPKPNLTIDYDLLVKHLSSKDTILHVMDLISLWKTYDEPLKEKCREIYSNVDTDDGRRIRNLWALTKQHSGKSRLGAYLETVCNYELVATIEYYKRKAGAKQSRASSYIIDTLVDRMNATSGSPTISKRQFHNKINELRKTRKVVGGFDGMLALLPLTSIGPQKGPRLTKFVELRDDNINHLHSLIANEPRILQLCAVGKAFEDHIKSGLSPLQDCPWEAVPADELAAKSEEELFDLLCPCVGREHELSLCVRTGSARAGTMTPQGAARRPPTE